MKDLMNLDATDYESDEHLENCMNSTRHEDWRPWYVSNDLLCFTLYVYVDVIVMYVDKFLLDYNVLLVYVNMLFFYMVFVGLKFICVAMKKKNTREYEAKVKDANLYDRPRMTSIQI